MIQPTIKPQEKVKNQEYLISGTAIELCYGHPDAVVIFDLDLCSTCPMCEAEVERDEAEKHNESLRDDLAAVEDQVGSLEQELDDQYDEKSELCAQIDEYEDQVQELEDEIRFLRDAVDTPNEGENDE